MAKIISVNPFHEINIPNEMIQMDDDYNISFALPINWFNHAQSCVDCNAFLRSFGKPNFQWILEVSNIFSILTLDNFEKIEDYFSNAVRFEISENFTGTKLRFKRTEITTTLIEAYQTIRKDEENYESCIELQNAQNYITQTR